MHSVKKLRNLGYSVEEISMSDIIDYADMKTAKGIGEGPKNKKSVIKISGLPWLEVVRVLVQMMLVVTNTDISNHILMEVHRNVVEDEDDDFIPEILVEVILSEVLMASHQIFIFFFR